MDLSKIDVNSLTEAELNELLPALEELAVNSPLDYTPHPKQKLFHQSKKKYRLLSGGNRSGKTEAGSVEDVMHLTGIYPSWFPEECKFSGPNEGRVVVTDYAVGATNFEKKLFKWLPKECIVDIKRTNKGAISKVFVKHISGGTSMLEILTHEQEDDVFEGWNGHWAHFDEPPPREKFVAMVRGLIDLSGRLWMTLTPISQPWLYDEFVLNEAENIEYITVDITENPYLPKDEVLDFAKHLTEDEKEARLHGRFRHLMGRVYKEFDAAVHIIGNTSIKMDKRWPVYFVLDPADRRPHHGIWAKVDPFGTIYIVDEIVYKGTIEQTSKEILKRELLNGIAPLEVVRILDPNKGETPSAVSGLKLKDEFARHAIYFLTEVNDDVVLGHLAVAERLMYDKTKELSSTNHPKLFFLKDTTRECVRQLQAYVWDDWVGKNKDARSAKEKPKDLNKDMPDCIRYLVVFNPWGISGRDEADPKPSKSTSITGYR